jgi:hypothetical protein
VTRKHPEKASWDTEALPQGDEKQQMVRTITCVFMAAAAVLLLAAPTMANLTEGKSHSV